MDGSVFHDYSVIWNEVYGDIQDVGPVHRHMRRLVAGVLADLEYRSVLEVGCGAGHNLPLLTEGRALERVTGVDIAPDALERARRLVPELDVQLLDIEQGAPAGRWDLVFSSLVLEHLPDDERALEHLREACAKHLLLTTIAGDFERYRAWDERVGHVRNYVRGELESKLHRAGFRVDAAIYWGFPFYTPIARTLQNRQPSAPSYGPVTRMLAALLYRLYFLNSHRRGDLLIVLAS
jgi:SAM-dependent methyltransferase